jgi:hypothetical protein
MIETIKLPDPEAAAVEREVGYIVRCIEPGPPATFEQATEIAACEAKRSGRRYGIFKVCAIAEPQFAKPTAVSRGIVESAAAAVEA